jgi:hypothetical protein
MGTSIGYLVFIAVFSFVLWYYPVYTGWCRINKRGAAILFCKHRKKRQTARSSHPDMYFIFGGFHVLYSLYMAIGIPYTGSAGFVVTIQKLISHSSAWSIIGGVFGLIACIGWLLQCIGGAVLYKLVWNFKNNNAEINWSNAKTEFTGLKVLFNLFRKTQK